jgi:hypothetical protein
MYTGGPSRHGGPVMDGCLIPDDTVIALDNGKMRLATAISVLAIIAALTCRALLTGAEHDDFFEQEVRPILIESKVHIHDLHATILHLLGLDHTKLMYRYASRDSRLTDIYGEIVTPIIA